MINFCTTRKQYTFPSKETAQAFADAAKRCRIVGRVVVKATLPERAGNTTWIHVSDKWSVYVKAFAFADEIELAELARAKSGKLGRTKA